MAIPEAVNIAEQQWAGCDAATNDRLHILYYAACTQQGSAGEQADAQGISDIMYVDEQAAAHAKEGAHGKLKVKGSMKTRFCQYCGTTESGLWRCVVFRHPEMGYHCNRCAMSLRNNGSLPLLPSKGVTDMQDYELYLKQLNQLAIEAQAKARAKLAINNKRAASEVDTNDNSKLHGKTKKSRPSPDGEELSASDAGQLSEGTTMGVPCQAVMMETELFPRCSNESSPSFTIPAYSGDAEKQPGLSRRADLLVAVMKDSRASSKSSPIKGKKQSKGKQSTRSSNSGEHLQAQHIPLELQLRGHNSGAAQNTAGILSGMHAQEPMAAPLPTPAPTPTPSASLPSSVPVTVPQTGVDNSDTVLEPATTTGAAGNAPHISVMPSNSVPTAGNQQMFQQYVLPPYYSIMPHGMMNASTGAGHAYAMAGMALRQGLPMMPMMMYPGMAMASGQHMPTSAMYVQPGMGMAYQAYAMQQLQQGQLNTAMSWVGNAQS